MRKRTGGKMLGCGAGEERELSPFQKKLYKILNGAGLTVVGLLVVGAVGYSIKYATDRVYTPGEMDRTSIRLITDENLIYFHTERKPSELWAIQCLVIDPRTIRGVTGEIGEKGGSIYVDMRPDGGLYPSLKFHFNPEQKAKAEELIKLIRSNITIDNIVRVTGLEKKEPNKGTPTSGLRHIKEDSFDPAMRRMAINRTAIPPIPKIRAQLPRANLA